MCVYKLSLTQHVICKIQHNIAGSHEALPSDKGAFNLAFRLCKLRTKTNFTILLIFKGGKKVKILVLFFSKVKNRATTNDSEVIIAMFPEDWNLPG